MKSVNVNKNQLLEKLQANRLIHIQEYNEAYQGYVDKVITALEKRLENIRLSVKSGNKDEKIHLHGFDLVVPTSHIKDYDQIIEMLKMEVDDTIELSYEEFTQYVLDDWDWKHGFHSVNSFYNSKK